ncbi:MAG: type II toxin-antitoxin system RelE/ParE family toxin [Nitrospira sp.]|nr:type II toxin-antitoxin system RelE/ParE family toxin [Nitrospira sp.]
MIKSFRDADDERIFKREFVKGFPREIQQRAFMKLNAIDAAVRLEALRLSPANRLEALKGHRNGEHSIRIND